MKNILCFIIIYLLSTNTLVNGYISGTSQNQSGLEKVKISAISLYNGGATATCSGDETIYRFATIIEDKDVVHANIFKGSDCAIAFTAKTRSDVDVAMITDVIVEVIEYKEGKNCITKVQTPAETKDVIYVSIKKPLNKRESFKADQYFEYGVLKKFEGWKITKSTPKRLIVRINATDPGIYTLLFKIKSRSYGEKEEEGVIFTMSDTIKYYFGR